MNVTHTWELKVGDYTFQGECEINDAGVLAWKYTSEEAPPERVEKIINGFKEVPIDVDLKLLGVAIDVFAHSRYYIIAKTVRALHSRFEEEKDPEDDLYDSKTSALFAYMAIERNSRAALALANHKPLKAQKKKMLEFAKRSLEVCEILQKEFFPNDKLVYEEFGCDYFRETQQVQKIN